MNTKKIAIFVVVAFSLYFATSALAWTNNEQYMNNMPIPAHDLMKIIEGEYEVVVMVEANNSFCKFKQSNVIYDSGYTKIHWFDGTVMPGEWTWACFDTIPPASVTVVTAYWTDEHGEYLGDAGPPVSSTAINYEGSTNVELGNYWVGWNQDANEPGDPIGDITISEVFWATTDIEIPVAELDGRLYDPDHPNYEPKIDWISLDAPNDPIAYGETASFGLGDLSEDTFVIFRFKAEGAGQTSEEIIEFQPPPPDGDGPTVSQWGLIVMALLLLTVGAIVIHKRRQVAV